MTIQEIVSELSNMNTKTQLEIVKLCKELCIQCGTSYDEVMSTFETIEQSCAEQVASATAQAVRAENAADASEVNKNAAEEYAEQANTSATHANTYKEDAQGSAQVAQTNATAAQGYANAAEDSEINAASSASAANTSASNASQSASDASASATAAASSETNASQSASDASASATAAASSESNASTSATNAAASATAAASSATNAATSEINAQSFAGTAESFAGDAGDAKNDAEVAATNAANSAAAAASSAATATSAAEDVYAEKNYEVEYDTITAENDYSFKIECDEVLTNGTKIDVSLGDNDYDGITASLQTLVYNHTAADGIACLDGDQALIFVSLNLFQRNGVKYWAFRFIYNNNVIDLSSSITSLSIFIHKI